MNEEFNVVIAEDEKRICSLIKALIDWDGLHLRLVGEAHDGVQALTLLQQEKVSIRRIHSSRLKQSLTIPKNIYE